MRIDAHHHVWDLDRNPQPWIREDLLNRTFAVEEYQAQMRRGGFDGSVLIQNLCDEAETVDMLALASANPWIVGVVGWIDLSADVDAAIARLRSCDGGDRLVAVRHQVQFEEDSDWLDRPAIRRGLERVGAHGLAFDAVIRPDQRASAVRAAREISGLNWILDHLGNPHGGRPDDGWEHAIVTLGGLPNVAAKVSGLGNLAGQGWTARSLRGVVRHALAAFGPDRLLFGSDWPVCLLSGDFTLAVTAAEEWFDDLPARAQAEIFGGSASRWYGLL
ncbi:amidohydrolase family protein [Microbacterium sp. NEAU-LLC]|uniref:Amidohydrolase family protein n=1 Tax=Microbacterium helvum TaxID=2773713 RepID=A0ABR8NTW4_9MICO|nr:amidohydrolase family protein [Microbacterium helvum]MBD3943604.1 amidohydrolase family protein [Microbacterium helvum]